MMFPCADQPDSYKNWGSSERETLGRMSVREEEISRVHTSGFPAPCVSDKDDDTMILNGIE